jgi:hypothetical protein
MASQIFPLSVILSDLRSSEERAATIAAGISDAQANWRPTGGRSWSIVQCLSHLARTNRLYAAAMHEAASRPGVQSPAQSSGIIPGWFSAWFLREMEPPVRTRMKARSKVLPLTLGDPNEAVAEFIASHEAIRVVVASCSKIDLNRVRFKNPFVPLLRFTVGTGLLVVNAHDRRHLWQAERAKAAQDFPRR